MFRNSLIFIALTFSLNAYAACRTEISCFKPKITWTYKGSQFVTVCHNYPSNSWQYRACRREAQGYFQERCKDLKKKLKTAHSEQRAALTKSKDLFCSHFRP